jgi:aspartyl-tRNA(Asn)/glutamyl-tRNA(Gln) amidotransferase subunit A
MQGADPADPFCLQRPVEPTRPSLDRPISGLRAALLDGWFRDTAQPEVVFAVDAVAKALGVDQTVSLTGVAEARAAAFCLTGASGGALHLDNLRKRPQDFDPATRDRLLAGALLPAAVIDRVRRLRLSFRDQLRAVFERCDVLIAPATPSAAPRLDQTAMMLGSQEVPLRANVGIYTQPISFIGLPVVTVPVDAPGGLPIGVQIIAPAWREDIALRVAAQLERDGVVSAPAPKGMNHDR